MTWVTWTSTTFQRMRSGKISNDKVVQFWLSGCVCALNLMFSVTTMPTWWRWSAASATRRWSRINLGGKILLFFVVGRANHCANYTRVNLTLWQPNMSRSNQSIWSSGYRIWSAMESTWTTIEEATENPVWSSLSTTGWQNHELEIINTALLLWFCMYYHFLLHARCHICEQIFLFTRSRLRDHLARYQFNEI